MSLGRNEPSRNGVNSRNLIRVETVPHGGFVGDEMRPGGIALELLPDAADGDSEIVDLLLLRRSPSGAQEVAVAEDPARVLRQFRQDREFLRREMDLVAIAADNPAGEIAGGSVC